MAIHVDVRSAGATGDGTTDDTANIATAVATAAAAGSVLYWTAGTYKTTSVIDLSGCQVDAALSATLLAAHDGVAVQIGSASLTSAGSWSLPIIQKQTQAWGSGDVGVKATSVQNVSLTIPKVTDFSVGVELTSAAVGTAYNSVTLGYLLDNEVNLRLSATGSGYVNENVFYGGRFHHTAGPGTNVAGVRHIELTDDSSFAGPNNNRWFAPSLESSQEVEDYLVVCEGANNRWVDARWEHGGLTPRVWFESTSARDNIIDGGFNADLIEVTETNGAGRNSVLCPGRQMRFDGSTTADGMFVSRVGGGRSAHYTILSGDRSPWDTDDVSNGWQVRIAAERIEGKHPAGSEATVVFDALNGRIGMMDTKGQMRYLAIPHGREPAEWE